MKKILVIILLIMIIILSSCSTNNTDDPVQLWWYDHVSGGGYDPYIEDIQNIIYKLKIYCDSNNIPFEVVNYTSKMISYEDYVLKRNVAMAKGNMILLDFIGNMHDMANNNADYSKLENYDKLLSAYKDRFCIPLGVASFAIDINNEAIEHYDINAERNVINYYDYLEIIQEMKEKGAKFKLSVKTHYDMLSYYAIKNGIFYLNENSEILKNKEELKSSIKKTIIDSYEDYKLYYENYGDFSYLNEELGLAYYYLYDEASGLVFSEGDDMHYISNYSDFMKLGDEITNKTFVVTGGGYWFPTAFMYKKVTNDKTYDVFNQLLDESYYKLITSRAKRDYLPVTDTEKIRELMEVDENWEHIGILKTSAGRSDKDKKTLSVVNEIYDMYIKDEEKSRHMSEYYFSNWEITNKIITLIDELMQKLIVENLDYNKKEVEDMINKQIDDFIINFNIHYK